MTRLTPTQARKSFNATLERVTRGGERVVLHRRGHDVAALISAEDLELLRAVEDRLDLEAARAALQESEERFSYDEVRAEL